MSSDFNHNFSFVVEEIFELAWAYYKISMFRTQRIISTKTEETGKVLISHNIEKLLYVMAVIMKSLDLDTKRTVNINVQFFRYFNI